MKNSEFRRLMAYHNAKRLDIAHRRAIPSKRTAKGAAKHVGVALKNSRVQSLPLGKLQYATHTYKALNPDSRLTTYAS